jgi:hypothetical protein
VDRERGGRESAAAVGWREGGGRGDGLGLAGGGGVIYGRGKVGLAVGCVGLVVG